MRKVPAEPVENAAKSSLSFYLKIALVALLVAVVVAFKVFDLASYVSLDVLKSNREALTEFVARNRFWAAILFGAGYAVVIAFSLPVGAVMTITIGFLFGWLGGGLIVVVGATIGATALFLVARSTIGGFLEAKAGPFIYKMEDGFRENALSYLLAMRLIPIFPFWLVNLVPAFLGVSTTTYVFATFFGIIPGTFVYASVGNGLGALIDAGDPNDSVLGTIFEPQYLAPLIGLAVLAILPVIYKKYQSRRKQAPSA